MRYFVLRFTTLLVLFAFPAVFLAQQPRNHQQRSRTGSAESATSKSASSGRGKPPSRNPTGSPQAISSTLISRHIQLMRTPSSTQATPPMRRIISTKPLRSIAAPLQPGNTSFEAHLSLGLLLARQNKLDEARTELDAATKLDAGQANATLKARAWRALAQIDRASDPATASQRLNRSLEDKPRNTPDDTLLAAELAEQDRRLRLRLSRLQAPSRQRPKIRAGQRRSRARSHRAKEIRRCGNLPPRRARQLAGRSHAHRAARRRACR